MSGRCRLQSSIVWAALLAVFSGAPVRAEVVCTQSEWAEQFKHVRIIALARVTGEAKEQYGATFSLSVVRSWKGNKKALTAHTQGGEDGGWLRVGDYVLVYANEADFEFDSCNQPQAAYEHHVQAEITALDKARHYPHLSLPPAALKNPSAK